MRRTWARLGGQLGLGFIAAGLLIIGLAWNGAAGVDFVSGQIPYLLSGGALGLGLIMLGAALIIVQNSRKDRSLVEAQLKELNTAIARLANAVGAGGPGGHNGGTAPRVAGFPASGRFPAQPAGRLTFTYRGRGGITRELTGDIPHPIPCPGHRII